MTETPLASIAILAHDARHFYRALHSALAQSYPQVEVVVCDSSGDPAVARMVKEAQQSSRVPLTHLIAPAALAYPQDVAWVLPHLKGEFVKFLMGDDWLLPPLLARQVAALQAYPESRLSIANRWLADEDGVILPPRLRNFALSSNDQLVMGGDLLSLFETVIDNFLGGLSGATFRAGHLKQVVPGFAAPSSQLQVDFDLALYVTALRHGPLALIGQSLLAERFHGARYQGLDVDQQHKDERLLIAHLIGSVGGERAPWPGSVRICNLPLVPVPEAEREYSELPLSRLLLIQRDTEHERVGADCDSFAAMYRQWLATREFSAGARSTLAERVAGWPSSPQVLPVVLARGGELGVTLASVAGQSYGACGVLVLAHDCTEVQMTDGQMTVPLENDWAGQLNRLLVELDGFDWFYLLEAGDELAPHTLLLLAERIATDAELCALFTDEDTRSESKPEPVLKPDFNLDLLRAFPFVGRALAFSRQRFAEVGGLDSAAGEGAGVDLMLRMAEQWTVECVGHVAEALLHAQWPYAQWLGEPAVVAAHRYLVEGHLQRLGQAFHWRDTPAGGFAQVAYDHPATPRVSILLLSPDNPALLQQCLDSLLEHTAWRPFEVLIGTRADESQASLARINAIEQLSEGLIRHCPSAGDATLGARYNALAAQATGRYLLLFSPDCQAFEAGWLDELMRQAQRPEIAVAGPKLLGADGRVEQAGLILGMRGVAGSPFVGEAPGAVGYLHRLAMPQNYSAVSQHCLLCKREVFEQLGGLLDTPLSNHFADVDFCLRARDAGWLVSWTPHARVGYQVSLGNIAQLRPGFDDASVEAFQRWAGRLSTDPAYNKNFSANSVSFTLDPGLKHGWQPFAQRIRPHLLCLPINPGAVGHYRLIQPFKALEQAGCVTGQVYHGVPSVIDVAKLNPDAVVFQGRYSERASEGIVNMRRFSKAFRVFELDDYLLDVPTENEHRRFLANEIQTSLRRGIGLCDRLVVSTETLAEVMDGTNSDIVVVPNMLPPERWLHLQGQRNQGSKPRVGWGGGTSHRGDLLLVMEVIKALANEVHWVFFGMCPDELRPYVHEFHPQVPLVQYPAKLASLNLDLAIAPLEQHIFNDCKSNLRLLEYGACGFPVVCTQTRSYRGSLPVTLVPDNTTAQWLDAIRAHLADPDGSARQGVALREAVQQQFMLHGPALQRWQAAWLPA